MNAAYSVLRPDLIQAIAPLLLMLVGLGLVTLWSMRAIAVRTAARRRWRPDERGTSELEFTIALPVFLVSVLTVVQVALMVNAYLVVDYAAYCAARSAAVWLPQSTPGEPERQLAADEEDTSEKRSRIRRAAAIAVLPIAPRLSRFRPWLTIPAPPQPIDAATLARLAAVRPQDGATLTPGRLAFALLEKWPYAWWGTEVSLRDDHGNPATSFADSTTVTARVTHKFEMAVPFAGPALGYALGDRYIRFIGSFYLPITTSYTLMLAAS